MIDQTTLDKLLFNLDKVEKLANIHGFKNVAIFKPLFFTDSNKLNFVAIPDFEGAISFFHLTDLESELSAILSCKTLFFPEDKINSRFKKYINKNKILLIQDNQEKIKKLFYTILDIKQIKISARSSEDISGIIFQHNTDHQDKSQNM